MNELYELFTNNRVIDHHEIDKRHDGGIENYGDYAKSSRRQINNLSVNGTDIPAILHGHVAGVVGSSINIQSLTQDRKVREEFELLIREHGKMFNFDITGRFDRNEGFRLIEWFKAQNGGVLVRYHYNHLWKIPMRVELIGVDRIDTSKNSDKIKNGLEKNRYGRITHIWLLNDDKIGNSSRYSMKHIVYYSPIWISLSQYTSVSRLVTILDTISKTGDYFDAELKAALERAKAGVYWSTELYAPIMDAFNNIIKNKGEKEGIAEAKKIMQELSAKGVSAYGATPIPQADKIHKTGQNTSSVMDSFTQQSQKAMASSMGASSVSTYKDIGIGNYASIKAAISYDEEGYKIDFSRLVSTVIDNYLERLFMLGVQIGRISIPKNEYFSNREKYHLWDILRVSKRSVDEKVSAGARSLDLKSGATTLVKEYGEKGLDYMTEMKKQIEADLELAQIRKQMFEDVGIEDVKLEPKKIKQDKGKDNE